MISLYICLIIINIKNKIGGVKYDDILYNGYNLNDYDEYDIVFRFIPYYTDDEIIDDRYDEIIDDRYKFKNSTV